MFGFLFFYSFFFFFLNPTCFSVVSPVTKWNSQLQVLKQSPTSIRAQPAGWVVGNEAGVGLQMAVCRRGQTRCSYGYWRCESEGEVGAHPEGLQGVPRVE